MRKKKIEFETVYNGKVIVETIIKVDSLERTCNKYTKLVTKTYFGTESGRKKTLGKTKNKV